MAIVNQPEKGYLQITPTETMAEKMTVEKQIAGALPPMSVDWFYTINGISKNKDGTIQLENKMRSDMLLRFSMFENSYFPTWVQAIKDYTLTTIDRAIDLRKKNRTWQTNVKQPIIRTYVDRLVQAIFDATFTIKAYPLAKRNQKKAKIVQHAIERCFSSSGAKKSIRDMGTTAILQGPGFARSGFNVSKEKIKEMKNPDEEKVYGVENTYAEFERVSEFCLLGEPFVPFYEQRDIIYRKVLPLKTILKRIRNYDTKVTKDHLWFIVKQPKPFSYKNYDKVRTIKYYQDVYVADINFIVDNLFQMKVDNDHCEYVERWTEDNLVLAINGYIIYDGKNPLPRGSVHPFKCINFTRFPGVWISDGVGTLLATQQKLYDGLFNTSFDLVKFAAGPMFLLQPGQSIEGSEKVLNYEPLSFLQVKGPGKIETFQLPTLDPTVAKTMQDMLQMADFAISPSSYNQIAGVSRSATDSQMRYSGLKDSVKQLITSMNEMLTVTANEWLKEMKMKMPKEFEISFFDDANKQQWETIKLKDLDGKWMFEWDSESIRDDNKVIERSQLNELTNFLMKFGSDPITGRRLIDNEKLVSNVMDLYNQDAHLSKEEYMFKMKEAKKDMIKIQTELQQYQQALYPQQGFQQGAMQTGEPQQSSSSNYNASGQTGEQQVAAPTSVASVMKAAME